MWSLRKITTMVAGLLSLVVCLGMTTLALSSDKAVYDTPDVEQPGRTIHGKVVKVAEQDRATGKSDVSVENLQTGEVVQLHLDKTTERKQTDADPAVGDSVVVKYDETKLDPDVKTEFPRV